MSPIFRRLFLLELREALRQPLTWMILLALFVAMVVAVAAGSTRVERDRASIERVAVERMNALAESKSAAQRYGTPSDLKIEYHRDPTDAFGYMNYFLVTHAVKPPLSLGALAVGQIDLHPSQIRIDFTSIFPDAAYDLGNPHELKLGRFDLAFVLIYLLPLGLIALAATRLSGEQDSGILRLIAAQPIRPATVAAAKYSALALICIVAVLGGATIALGLNSQLSATSPLLLVGCMVGLWILFWIALAALVATLWRGAIASIVTLTLLWGSFTLLLPAAAAMLIEVTQPSPSRIAYIDSSRQVMDSFYGDEAQVHAAWLNRFPQFAALATQMARSPEVKRFARDEYYRQSLMPKRKVFEERARAVLDASDGLRLLSPAMMLDDALQTASGSDLRRHADFLAATDAYSERLRRYFEPLALANVAHPARACPDCPGRMNFTRYDEVPVFEANIDTTAGLRRTAWTCLYLAVLALAASQLARRRLRQWPI